VGVFVNFSKFSTRVYDAFDAQTEFLDVFIFMI